LNTGTPDFEEKQPVQKVQREQLPKRTRVSVQTGTLSGLIMQGSNPTYCMFYWEGRKIFIHAIGKKGRRKISVETLSPSGDFSTHVIIKSGMFYIWNTTNHKGEKFAVATQAVKKLLDKFQVNPITKCMEWRRAYEYGYEYKFELPTNIDF
jgi:hypothetical protein